eukprot:GHVT01076258.1.p1 GENE.GHVT01076258.1~~GHVT01076258.1.p1  ORF type:complete len:323 (-),score=81.44 GHVT01076258.1:2045-3013(-)
MPSPPSPASPSSSPDRKKSHFGFEVEVSKSGRARCRGCNQSIGKGELRLGVNPPASMAQQEKTGVHGLLCPKWLHLKCLTQFRKSASWWVDNCPPIDTFKGYLAIDEPQKKLLVDAVAAACQAKPKEALKPISAKTELHTSSGDGHSNAAKGPATDQGTKKRKSDEGPKSNSSKKVKTVKQPSSSSSSCSSSSASSTDSSESSTSSSLSAAPPLPAGVDPARTGEVQAAAEALRRKSMTQLKEMLRKNKQKLGGVKDELINRVAECQVLGALPICPTCEKSLVQFVPDKNIFKCPGYWDEEARHFKRCPFKADKIERPPWEE